MQKEYVNLDSFRADSYRLAADVLASGFRPDFLVALWRGGAIPGICMHEAFKWAGLHTDHIAIRTSKYTGIDEASTTVQVHNLGYICDKIVSSGTECKMLIVDDIFDTGHSVHAVFAALRERLGHSLPQDIRVATVYYKPERNKTMRVPEYFVHTTNSWVVFPHEVEGMSLDEIERSKGAEIASIFASIKK